MMLVLEVSSKARTLPNQRGLQPGSQGQRPHVQNRHVDTQIHDEYFPNRPVRARVALSFWLLGTFANLFEDSVAHAIVIDIPSQKPLQFGRIGRWPGVSGYEISFNVDIKVRSILF
jgi:hypothetical protein